MWLLLKLFDKKRESIMWFLNRMRIILTIIGWHGNDVNGLNNDIYL